MNEVKREFLNGIEPHVYMEKVIFLCIRDNIAGITEHKTWIEVGLKHHA